MSNPNRRLSAFGSNPGADPAGVTDDRGEDEQLDVDDDRPDYLRGDDADDVDVGGDDEETCNECDRTAEFSDPSEALGNDSLPSVPLCRSHILEHA